MINIRSGTKVLSLILGVIFLLTACTVSNNSPSNVKSNVTLNETTDREKIILSCVAFNYDEVNNPVAIKKMNELGYDVEVVVLEDATTMNEAVLNGDINASLHQHKPWMDAYNNSKDKDVFMLTPYIHYNVFGMYSDKYKTVEELPDGATLTIPQDSSNMARALLLLEQQGLIKLQEGVAIPTTLDIIENPKNLVFNEIHVHQVVSSLPDVDAICCAKMFMVSNNISLDKEICTSDDLEDFGVGFVINPDRKNEPWVDALIKAYTSDGMRDEINNIFKGCYVPGF